MGRERVKGLAIEFAKFKYYMRTWLLTKSNTDPLGCSVSAKAVVGSTSRRVIVIRARCNGRQHASGGSIEVKMFDFLDDESLRVGNILGRDTPEGYKRNADREEGLHGHGLGNGIQPHGARKTLMIVTPQR